MSDLDMARKKEMIMMQSLKRRQEQEQLRLKKEHESAVKRAHEQAKRDEAERKRDEEKRRRELILEQYRLRKAQEEAEKNGAPPLLHAQLQAGKFSLLLDFFVCLFCYIFVHLLFCFSADTRVSCLSRENKKTRHGDNDDGDELGLLGVSSG